MAEKRLQYTTAPHCSIYCKMFMPKFNILHVNQKPCLVKFSSRVHNKVYAITQVEMAKVYYIIFAPFARAPNRHPKTKKKKTINRLAASKYVYQRRVYYLLVSLKYGSIAQLYRTTKTFLFQTDTHTTINSKYWQPGNQ